MFLKSFFFFFFFFFCTYSYRIQVIFYADLFNPKMGPEQILSLRVRVDLGVMEIKGYTTFSKAPGQESHHQVQFNAIYRKLVRQGPFSILYLSYEGICVLVCIFCLHYMAEAVSSGSWPILFKVLKFNVAICILLLHFRNFCFSLSSVAGFCNTGVRAPTLVGRAIFFLPARKAMRFGQVV